MNIKTFLYPLSTVWIIAFATLLSTGLTACSTEKPIDLSDKASSVGIVSFGTLSDSSDAVEAAASVVITRLAQYRFNAASLLRQKRISLDSAKLALKESDLIRAYLDKAVLEKNLFKIQYANKQIDRSAKQLEQGL